MNTRVRVQLQKGVLTIAIMLAKIAPRQCWKHAFIPRQPHGKLLFMLCDPSESTVRPDSAAYLRDTFGTCTCQGVLTAVRLPCQNPAAGKIPDNCQVALHTCAAHKDLPSLWPQAVQACSTPCTASHLGKGRVQVIAVSNNEPLSRMRVQVVPSVRNPPKD